jgi:hypothetical protein
LKSNIDLNDSDDDNLCNNVVGFDIVNSIDSTGEIDDVELPCEVENLQSERIEEFESENEAVDEMDNANENYDDFRKDLCHWYVNNRIYTRLYIIQGCNQFVSYFTKTYRFAIS